MLAGPPAIGGDDGQGPIPPSRGLHAGAGEVQFECGPRVGFFPELLDEFSLARRRGGESGGGAFLRLLMRCLGIGQPQLQHAVLGRVFRDQRGPSGGGFSQSSGQLRFHAGELPGGRGRFRHALLGHSFEGGRGFGLLPLECGAGGGVFLTRRVVSRLKFRESRRGPCQFRRVPPVRVLMRGLGGTELPVETRASVGFLSEQVFERGLALVRGGKVARGGLTGVLMRRFCFDERVLESQLLRQRLQCRSALSSVSRRWSCSAAAAASALRACLASSSAAVAALKSAASASRD